MYFSVIDVFLVDYLIDLNKKNYKTRKENVSIVGCYVSIGVHDSRLLHVTDDIQNIHIL